MRPDVPACVHAAVRQGLAKDPASRFASAEQMADVLRAGSLAADDTLVALARDADRTLVQAAPQLSQSRLGLDSSITTTERGLARHVGPIAAHLVRSAVSRSASVEALCDALAASINSQSGRDTFRKEVQLEFAAAFKRSSATTGLSAILGNLTEAEIAGLQAELARYVGPIARILVKRAAPGCRDVLQLRKRLAENISGVERAAFPKEP